MDKRFPVFATNKVAHVDKLDQPSAVLASELIPATQKAVICRQDDLGVEAKSVGASGGGKGGDSCVCCKPVCECCRCDCRCCICCKCCGCIIL